MSRRPSDGAGIYALGTAQPWAWATSLHVGHSGYRLGSRWVPTPSRTGPVRRCR